ncbi:hypothetical protein F4806DRAFT_467700 [Annulohypoxylon nitens]|nr:hypothetical protein F4806DRAFT_467700 [Annulohypoxylon nitens]
MSSAVDVASYKGPVGCLTHRCPLCPSRPATNSPLLRCAGCRAFFYCSREHQVAHRPEHKSLCSKIKKARAKLDQEEDKVRNATADFMTPANAFETCVGRFWGILSTRDYMRARSWLAHQLLLLGTLHSVREGLEHMRDMLRLCRSDNLGIRDIVPATMLRLDLDQECYDFMKWWATCDPNGTYDWGDMSLPYLNLHGANALEDPGFLIGKYASLNFLVALLILKLKLLVDIRNLKVTRKIFAIRKILGRRHVPIELQDQIAQHVVRSPLSVKLKNEPQMSLIKTEMKLSNQIRKIGACIVENNEHFMFNLFEPEEPLGESPDHYSHGSWEEMAFAMQYSYATWWETEGVLDLLNDARACAARDSELEIDDWMENKKARKGRTATELLHDLGINRIWGYLDYAVENASYLGPWSERPSEQHTRENREAMESDDELWSDDED